MSVIWKNKYAYISTPEPIFTFIIAAGGSGTRMGGVYKPLSDICGKPMLAYSLEAFEKSGFVRQIVITAPEDRIKEVESAAKEYSGKVKCVVPGGSTRAESVKAGFRAAFDRKEDITPFVAVHDAARPLVSQEIINNVCFGTVRYGAAVAALKVRDALKHTLTNGFIDDDIDRENVWQMQTPQAFDTDIYHTALATLSDDVFRAAPDDAALVTAAGFKVLCVDGSVTNFKVTYPEDLEMARAIISARKSD